MSMACGTGVVVAGHGRHFLTPLASCSPSAAFGVLSKGETKHAVEYCGRNDVRALLCVNKSWVMSDITVERISRGYDRVVAPKVMSTPGCEAFGALGFLDEDGMRRIRCLNREWSDSTTTSIGYAYMFLPRGKLYGKVSNCVTQKHRDANARAAERRRRLSVFPARLGRRAHVISVCPNCGAGNCKDKQCGAFEISTWVTLPRGEKFEITTWHE